MRTLIVGGEHGVRAYTNAIKKIRAAGCTIVGEIPGARAVRSFKIPPETELILVLTTWAGHSAINQVRSMLSSMDGEINHVFAPHQWSRLKPHLDRVGVVPGSTAAAPPAPPPPAIPAVKPTKPKAKAPAQKKEPIVASNQASPDPKSKTLKESEARAREFIQALIAEMAILGIASVSVSDGKARIVRHETWEV